MNFSIKGIASTVLILLVLSLGFSEDNQGKVQIDVESVGRNRFVYTYRDERIHKLRDFYPIMEDVPEAVSELDRARANRVFAPIIYGIGVLFVANTIVVSENDRYGDVSKLYLMTISISGTLLCLVAGHILSTSSRKRLREGVGLYNESVASHRARMPDFEVAISHYCVGVGVYF